MSATTGQSRYTRLTQAQVDAICQKHERLKAMKPGGARAVFAWMDVSGLDFRGRDLRATGCENCRSGFGLHSHTASMAGGRASTTFATPSR